MAAVPLRLFGEFSKVEDQDDGTIKVYGIASTSAKDSAGETVTSKAMADALPEYEQFPALREMHQLSVAGRVTDASVDKAGVTNIVAHVVDPVAIAKVKAGVYAGFSIGGKALERDPADRTIITKLRLNEISLVDRPCNPEAVMTMWKAEAATEEDHMTATPWSPANADVIAKADELMTAAGKKSRSNFMVAARDALIKAHTMTLAEGDAEVAAEAQADEAEQEALEANEDAERAAEAAETVKAATVDPVAALNDAIEKATAAVTPPAEPAASIVQSELEEMAKALTALDTLDRPDTLRKGMRGIASLCYAIYGVVAVQQAVQEEANKENDGSEVPAAIAAAVKQLGDALIAMAKEEVAELVDDIGPDQMIIPDTDDFMYAAKTVDLIKADTDLMEKAGARNSKKDASAIQAMHDHAAALGAQCASTEKAATADDIAKAEATTDAITKATTALEAMTVTVSTLQKRISDLENSPAPPKGAVTPHGLTAVSKAQDLDPSDDASAPVTKADITRYLDGLPKEERDLVLVKMALNQPISANRR